MPLFLIIFAIVVTCLSIATHGFVLNILWKWFIVSTFGLPALSFVAACGVMTVSVLMTHPYQQPTKKLDEMTGSEIFRSIVNGAFVRPALLLLVGWAFHTTM